MYFEDDIIYLSPEKITDHHGDVVLPSPCVVLAGSFLKLCCLDWAAGLRITKLWLGVGDIKKSPWAEAPRGDCDRSWTKKQTSQGWQGGSDAHGHTDAPTHAHSRGDLLRRMMTQSRMATRAPVVRPSEKGRTSGLQDCMFPRLSQAHTRTISVLVLLWMG